MTSVQGLPNDAPVLDPYRAADLNSLVRLAAESFGDRESLRFEGQSMSFTELDRSVNRVASFLIAHGVAPGDRVAIMLPNSLDWPVTWLGVLRAGAIVVPINSSLKTMDLSFVLSDSGATAIVSDEDHQPLIAGVLKRAPRSASVFMVEEVVSFAAPPSTRFPEVTADSVANLQYTSGTTGFPKACILTHDYWVSNSRVLGESAEITGRDVVLTAQPFSYVDPQWNLAMCLLNGAPLVVVPRFSASGFWPAVRENRATYFYVLGTMPMLLFKQKPTYLDRANTIRLVHCSGIVPSLHQEFEDRWGAPWRELYGLTEEGGCLIVPLADASVIGSGVVGRPVGEKDVVILSEDGEEVATGDPGEIVVRGRPIMRGYWQRPAETDAVLNGNQFRTGDIGTKDADGWVRLIGRMKDMIRRGGENIAAAEVERALNQHELVATTAAVAVADELWGEEIKACIELSGAARDLTDTESAVAIAEFARENLARFKIPRYIQFTTNMPRTPSERVAKKELRAALLCEGTPCFDTTESRWTDSSSITA